MSKYIELVEPLSWSADGDMVTAMMSSSDGDIVIDFPLHEDFLDFVNSYREQYKIYIDKKINEN
jgi:hypothetical protein